MTQTIRAPRSDAVANREGILTAAREVFAQDPRASIDLVARTAGLTRRALYGHFEDRAALVQELILTGAQRFNSIAEETIADDDRPQLALARLASRLWRAAAHVQLIAAVALDDEHLAATAAALAPVRGVLGGLVERGQADGSLRADMDATELARLIEEVARVVVARADAFDDTASVAVRAVLGIAGLSWRESEDLLHSHPEILEGEA